MLYCTVMLCYIAQLCYVILRMLYCTVILHLYMYMSFVNVYVTVILRLYMYMSQLYCVCNICICHSYMYISSIKLHMEKNTLQ
jgi:hypothetical protein